VLLLVGQSNPGPSSAGVCGHEVFVHFDDNVNILRHPHTLGRAPPPPPLKMGEHRKWMFTDTS